MLGFLPVESVLLQPIQEAQNAESQLPQQKKKLTSVSLSVDCLLALMFG